MDKPGWQKKGQGHRARLRDRFLNNGLTGFSEVEVLELLLSFGTPRTDCKEPARLLLEKFGTFSKVLEAPVCSLSKIKGIGPKNSFALSFIQGVASYYLKERLNGKEYLHSSKEVSDYLIYTMRGLNKEIMTVIFLDSSHAIIDSEVVSEGTLNVNTVYPREIVKKALECHAAAIILAHNHPSGALQPSQQDITLTRKLFFICYSMQIQLLDHFVVGDGSFSFADNGLMETIKAECRSAMAPLDA